jgi:hypothetical protein
MLFSLYQLKREFHVYGMRLNLSLLVDCERKEADFTLRVDGIIRPTSWGTARFEDMDKPEKAEAYFRKIDLDRLAEEIWLERRKAAAEAGADEKRAKHKAELEATAETTIIAKGWAKGDDGHWRNPKFPAAKSARARYVLEDWES